MARPVGRGRRGVGGELQGIEGHAGVPVRHDGKRLEGVRGDRDRTAETALVGEGAQDDHPHFGFPERLEHEDAGPREQRGDHLEGGVLGRRADEGDIARLDVWKHGILLGLVEAVDLVDEDHRSFTGDAAHILRLLDDAPELGNAGRDRGERDETGLRTSRDDRGERRLPGARRSPEDHRWHLTGVDRLTQHALGADELLLADVLVQLARSHARGKRPAGALRLLIRSTERGEERRRLGTGTGSTRTGGHAPSIDLDSPSACSRII